MNVILAGVLGAMMISVVLLFRQMRQLTWQLTQLRVERDSDRIMDAITAPRHHTDSEGGRPPPQPVRHKRHLALYLGAGTAAALTELAHLVGKAVRTPRTIATTAVVTAATAAVAAAALFVPSPAGPQSQIPPLTPNSSQRRPGGVGGQTSAPTRTTQPDQGPSAQAGEASNSPLAEPSITAPGLPPLAVTPTPGLSPQSSPTPGRRVGEPAGGGGGSGSDGEGDGGGTDNEGDTSPPGDGDPKPSPSQTSRPRPTPSTHTSAPGSPHHGHGHGSGCIVVIPALGLHVCL